MHRAIRALIVPTLFSMLTATAALSQVAPSKDDTSDKAQALIDKGLAYLKTQQQPDGLFQRNEKDQPAVTALALKAFAGSAKDAASDPIVAKGYEGLLRFQKPDGGIYRDALANYNTAIAVSA